MLPSTCRRRSGRNTCVHCFHKIQNRVNNGIITDRCVDHRVINSSIGPFDIENEGRETVAGLGGVLFELAHRAQAHEDYKEADRLVNRILVIDPHNPEALNFKRDNHRLLEQQAGTIRHMTEEHLTTEEVGKMAARAGVKTVVLTHLPATTDPKDDYKRFVGQVQKQFSGAVLIANDLMEF